MTPADAVEGAGGVRSHLESRVTRDPDTPDDGADHPRDLRKPEARRLVEACVTADTGR